MSKVYLIPVIVFSWFQITFVIIYIAAVLQGHVVPTVPYISDAATYSPESCVFGQLINMGSVLLGITIYIRYLQVRQVFEHHPDLGDHLLNMNRIAAWIGIVSCIGISIVANFQETNIRVVHLVGAFFAFGFGTLYFCLQALISHILYPLAGTKSRVYLRIAMATACIIFFIILVVTGIMSHILFKGQDPRKWYPSDGGWYFHVVSSISEWIVATIFSFYILTFTDEFYDIHVDHPTLRLISHSSILQQSQEITPDI